LQSIDSWAACLARIVTGRMRDELQRRVCSKDNGLAEGLHPDRGGASCRPSHAFPMAAQRRTRREVPFFNTLLDFGCLRLHPPITSRGGFGQSYYSGNQTGQMSWLPRGPVGGGAAVGRRHLFRAPTGGSRAASRYPGKPLIHSLTTKTSALPVRNHYRNPWGVVAARVSLAAADSGPTPHRALPLSADDRVASLSRTWYIVNFRGNN
jgi:hypothetical protein